MHDSTRTVFPAKGGASRLLAVMMLAGSLLVLPSCDDEKEQGGVGKPDPQQEERAAETGPSVPPPEGQAVWDWLIETEYRNWDLFPGTTPFYEASGPHGPLVTTYANPIAIEAIEDSDDGEPFPINSMVVKENYDEGRELVSVTVMYRSEGFDERHNDWFWLERTAAGEIESEGKVDSCASCHGEGGGNYLRTSFD